MRGGLWLLLYSLTFSDHLMAHYINDFDKANAFNKFFHGVFIADDGNNTPDFNLHTNANMDCPGIILSKVIKSCYS